jgi:hypothetical protein
MRVQGHLVKMIGGLGQATLKKIRAQNLINLNTEFRMLQFVVVNVVVVVVVVVSLLLLRQTIGA